MTVQIYNAEQVELLRSIFPDRERYAQFAYNVSAQWYDFPLHDTVDGEHFNQNANALPTGWTEVDAAIGNRTDIIYGFWRIVGGSGTGVSWKYRRQMTFNVETDSADGDWISFNWGPIFIRDGNYPADVNYRFGIYRNNAGIDENTFIRVHLQWNAVGGAWRARTERKDGTTQTDGSYVTLYQYPQPGPLYVRQVIRYFASNTNEPARGYIGTLRYGDTHTQLNDSVMNITWGAPWFQVQCDRGSAGNLDFLYIGAVDRNDTP